jgi:ribosomal-protein-alanine N-acetyltransferase
VCLYQAATSFLIRYNLPRRNFLYQSDARMTPQLHTDRLILRPLELDDAEQVQILFPQWEIVRFLANRVPWPFPPDGARSFYRDVALPAAERGEAWHWTLRLKTDPARLIGSISLTKGEDDNRGFWIGIPWRGQGLMSEACDVVTDFWFDELKFPVLRAPKAIANLASRRVSEKQGMRVIRTEERDYVSGRLPSEVWEITADEWHARRTGTGN